MKILSSGIQVIKKLIVGDLEQRVTKLENDMKKVWSELGKIEGFQYGLQLRVEHIYQDFGGYKYRTQAELLDMKKVLEALLDDVDDILNKIDTFDKDNLAKDDLLRLVSSRNDVKTLKKRTKNNLTRINRELVDKEAA